MPQEKQDFYRRQAKYFLEQAKMEDPSGEIVAAYVREIECSALPPTNPDDSRTHFIYALNKTVPLDCVSKFQERVPMFISHVKKQTIYDIAVTVPNFLEKQVYPSDIFQSYSAFEASQRPFTKKGMGPVRDDFATGNITYGGLSFTSTGAVRLFLKAHEELIFPQLPPLLPPTSSVPVFQESSHQIETNASIVKEPQMTPLAVQETVFA